jgi:16S rRNA (guanine527-N7)-methyltransferase
MTVDPERGRNPSMHRPPDQFARECEALGIAFEPGDLEKLGEYLTLLLDANTRFNLTAITDPAEAWMRHIFDSLTLMPLLVNAEVRSVIDVGSGGGLPGMPLAIVMPGVRFTLLEATGKKAAFLRESALRLGLANVDVLSERAETAGQDDRNCRERFDAVVARAVGKLSVLVELTAPLARVGGHILAIKGEKAAEEITEAKQALHHLHCAVVSTVRTPTGTIIIMEKQRKSPRIYPRRPGEPKRAPLR